MRFETQLPEDRHGSPRGPYAAAFASRSQDWELETKGYADVEQEVPFSRTSRFNIGSVAKVLTAAMVHATWNSSDQRRDTRLGDVIPQLAGTWLGAVDIESLLTHRAGTFDFRSILQLQGRPRMSAVPRSRIVDLAVCQQHRSPHTQYSNTGFVLLGLALECERRQSFGDIFQYFFGDACGRPSRDPAELIQGRARGYERTRRGVQTWLFFADAPGASQVWSSVDELANGVTSALTMAPHAEGTFASADGSGVYATGSDGGFSCSVFIKGDKVEYVAVTNSPTSSALEMIQRRYRLASAVPSEAMAEVGRDQPVDPNRVYTCREFDLTLRFRNQAAFVGGDAPNDVEVPLAQDEAKFRQVLDGVIELDYKHLRGLRFEY